MMKYLLFCFLGLQCFGLSAHQPDISTTMIVAQKDGSWILQVRAALTAFEYEVHHHFGKDAYKTPGEFQDLVIQHFEENLIIQPNQTDPIVLQKGFVKLGHETNLIFQLNGFPKTINTLSVQNSGFKNIYKNKSGLIIFKEGFEKKQFILNNENKHQVHLEVKGNNFNQVSDEVKSVAVWSYLYMIFPISLLVFVASGFPFKPQLNKNI